jgi:hypothetical protein
LAKACPLQQCWKRTEKALSTLRVVAQQCRPWVVQGVGVAIQPVEVEVLALPQQ